VKVIEAHVNEDGSFDLVVEDPDGYVAKRLRRCLLTSYTDTPNRIRGARSITAAFDRSR